MNKVSFKPGVRFKEFSPALEHILHHLRRVESPVDLTVTSVNDGEHMTLSRHYTNEALDLRSKNFPSLREKREFQKRLQEALGPMFSVLFENVGEVQEHFHCQVRRGKTFEGA